MAHRDIDRRRAYHRDWYHQNIDTQRDRQKGYSALPHVKERRKELRDANPERGLWRGAKDRSLRKGLEFNIEISDIVIPNICPILRIKLGRFDRKTAPSLDRIDNTRGYIKGNVRVISNRANVMKGDMSLEDIERLSAYAKGEL